MGSAPDNYAIDATPAYPTGAVYDPGALLSAVVAVLAAEGLPANAGPGLPACAQLLARQGIGLAPGAPAPTAHGLTAALLTGPPGRGRVMAPGLLAAVIRVVLTADGVLPAHITTDDADTLITATAIILQALGVHPDDDTGSLDQWPVIANIINAAPQLPPPHEPPPDPHRQRGR